MLILGFRVQKIALTELGTGDLIVPSTVAPGRLQWSALLGFRGALKVFLPRNSTRNSEPYTFEALEPKLFRVV